MEEHYAEAVPSLPASASASNHVKVVAWLRRIGRVDRLHKLLKDEQRRKATNPAAIEGEQTQVLTSRHVANESDIKLMALKKTIFKARNKNGNWNARGKSDI